MAIKELKDWLSLTETRQYTKPASANKNIREGISLNPLRPNNDLSQISPYNIQGLSVSELLRIENMITQMKFY